jgi:hypothetical protein
MDNINRTFQIMKHSFLNAIFNSFSVFCLVLINNSVSLADSTSATAIEVVEASPSEIEKSKVKAALPKPAESKNDSFATGTSRVTPGLSLQSAKGEKLAIAMGHYARSRALLISALREFDKGYELVDPSALLDSEGWRQGVTMRAQELARVLDPQPRAARSGVRFDSSTAGIGDAGATKKR